MIIIVNYVYIILAYYDNNLSFFGQITSEKKFNHFVSSHQVTNDFTTLAQQDLKANVNLEVQAGQIQTLPLVDTTAAKSIVKNYQLQSISAFRYNHASPLTDTIMNLLPDTDTLSIPFPVLTLPILVTLTPSQSDRLVTEHEFDHPAIWTKLGQFTNYQFWPDQTDSSQLVLSLLAQQILAQQVQTRALIPLRYLLPDPFTARIAARVLSLVLNRNISRSNIRRDFSHQLHIIGKDRTHRGNPINLLTIRPINEDLQRPAKLNMSHRIS